MKYVLEIETEAQPPEMQVWALKASEHLDPDATWSLTGDDKPLLSLSLEMRES